MPASTAASPSAAAGWRRPCWTQLFTVLAPAALSATAAALAEADTAHRTRLAVFEKSVERARYEADRARRQYDHVEPENRLVARTLEAALEDKLAAVRSAENDLAARQSRRPIRLTAAETAWLTTAGADVRAVFDAPTTTTLERKQLIRAVIAEVVVRIDQDTRDTPPADRLAGRGGHRGRDGDDQARRPPPGHRRGHRGPGPAGWPSTTTTPPSR